MTPAECLCCPTCEGVLLGGPLCKCCQCADMNDEPFLDDDGECGCPEPSGSTDSESSTDTG
jgi:hypothetical protein